MSIHFEAACLRGLLAEVVRYQLQGATALGDKNPVDLVFLLGFLGLECRCLSVLQRTVLEGRRGAQIRQGSIFVVVDSAGLVRILEGQRGWVVDRVRDSLIAYFGRLLITREFERYPDLLCSLLH